MEDKLIMGTWKEVRRGVPPSEVDVVPDMSIDYEVWMHYEHGLPGESLTIYAADDRETYWLVRHDEEGEEELIDVYNELDKATKALEEHK